MMLLNLLFLFLSKQLNLEKWNEKNVWLSQWQQRTNVPRQVKFIRFAEGRFVRLSEKAIVSG